MNGILELVRPVRNAFFSVVKCFLRDFVQAKSIVQFEKACTSHIFFEKSGLCDILVQAKKFIVEKLVCTIQKLFYFYLDFYVLHPGLGAVDDGVQNLAYRR